MNRGQAVSWTNDNKVYWRIHVSFGLDDSNLTRSDEVSRDIPYAIPNKYIVHENVFETVDHQ